MSSDGAGEKKSRVPQHASSEDGDEVYAVFCDLVDLGAEARAVRLRRLRRRSPSLAVEVEGLLGAADRSNDILRNLDQIFAWTTGEETAQDPDALIGRELQQYRVEGRLGRGGMGVVFRARDTRLDRRVALKFLPPVRGWHAGSRYRLLREARAASTLDHPNIATVHDVLETPDGRGCIVMAHYEGHTLKHYMRDAPLDPATVCEVGAQVACGLEAAHGRGIVHCDIKPENIFITDSGVVKILDFGLARFMDGGGSPRAPLVGTIPYMAPEQLRGGTVSARTDLWALGVVLYEMATGKRPFDEGPSGDPVRRILGHPPVPPSRENPDLPGWLDDVILAMLEADPGQRPQAARDVRETLEKGCASRDTPLPASRQGRRAPRPRGGLPITGILLTVLAMILGVWLLVPGSPSPHFGRPRQLTSAEGAEDFASWSPAADAIVYQGMPGGEIFVGEPDIFLHKLGAEAPTNLTADHRGADGRPSWSPDGCCIAFYSDRQGGGFFIERLGDGGIRKLSEVRWTVYPHNRAAWSPDGRRIAVTADGGAKGAVVEVISAEDGGLLRTLPLPGRAGNMIFGTTWSPDGRFLAMADAMNMTPDEAKLWVVRMEDGEAFPVTDGRDLAWSPAWGADSRTLYYVSDRSGSRDLWVQGLDDDGRVHGEPTELTTGIGMRNIALSEDGARLAYSKGKLIAHVWRVPILETRAATWDDAEQITFDRAYVEFVEVDRDGQSVFVSSNRSGGQDLWVIEEPARRVERRLTFAQAADWAPVLSPDGTRVAYYSARSGNRDIWVQDLETGTEAQVTHDGGIDFVPSWSPDGRRLAFASGRTGNLDIWTVDLDSGALRQLTDHPAADGWPQWSPDGSTIAFRSKRDGTSQLWSVPAEGGVPGRVTSLETTYFRWARDGSCFYLISGGQLWVHERVTGSERPLTALAQRQGALGVVALAVDTDHLYFTWEEDVVDLWMMDRIE